MRGARTRRGFLCYWVWGLFVAILAAASLSSAAAGQAPPAPVAPPGGPLRLSLADAINVAVTGNLILQRARLEVDTKRLQVPIQQSAFHPTVTLTASRALEDASTRPGTDEALPGQRVTTTFGPSITNRFLTGTSVTLTQTNTRPDSVTDEGSSAGFVLTVTQPLLKGAGIAVNRAATDIAKNEVDNSIRDLERQLIETVSNVEAAYLDLLLALDDRKIKEQALEGAKQQLEINRFLIQVGRLPARELAAAQAAVSSAELEVATARNAVENARRALLRLLNVDPVDVVPTDALTFSPVAVDPVEALETALKRQPELVQRRLAVENARIQANRDRNNVLYDLSVTARFETTVGTSGPLTKSVLRSSEFKDVVWSVGGTLTIPLDNSAARNTYLSSLNTLRQREFDLKDAEQGTRLDLNNAVKNLEINAFRVAEAERGQTLAQQRLETESVKFREGRASNADVIAARQALVTAQNALLRAIVDYQKSRVDLERRRGTALDRWNIDVK